MWEDRATAQPIRVRVRSFYFTLGLKQDILNKTVNGSGVGSIS